MENASVANKAAHQVVFIQRLKTAGATWNKLKQLHYTVGETINGEQRSEKIQILCLSRLTHKWVLIDHENRIE